MLTERESVTIIRTHKATELETLFKEARDNTCRRVKLQKGFRRVELEGSLHRELKGGITEVVAKLEKGDITKETSKADNKTDPSDLPKVAREPPKTEDKDSQALLIKSSLSTLLPRVSSKPCKSKLNSLSCLKHLVLMLRSSPWTTK
jgi:hypothetical protein